MAETISADQYNAMISKQGGSMSERTTGATDAQIEAAVKRWWESREVGREFPRPFDAAYRATSPVQARADLLARMAVDLVPAGARIVEDWPAFAAAVRRVTNAHAAMFDAGALALIDRVLGDD